jgi:chromosome partitioning protein
MGQVVSLIARKGGVGKTTLAANLASELSTNGANVCLLDFDPQGSLTMWASVGSGFLASRVTKVAPGNEEVLRSSISRLRQESDFLVIDTPPGFTEPALYAAQASDLVLLPCGASPLDLAAGRDAISFCREVQRLSPGGKPAIGLVPSRYLQNSSLGRDLAGSLAQLGERTLPGIAHRVAFAEAAISGLTIGEYGPKSVAHKEFMELVKAVRSCLDEKRNQTAKTQVNGIR